jgi:hypothetical protein
MTTTLLNYQILLGKELGDFYEGTSIQGADRV